MKTIQTNDLPFDLLTINIPVGIISHSDTNHSEISVLMNALDYYKYHAEELVDPEERDSMLNSISDLKTSIQDAMFDRLSDSADAISVLQRPSS